MVKSNVNEQNFGGNIYDSYVNRPNDYGNYIGQETSLNTSMLWVQLAYELFPKWSTNIYADAQIRQEANNRKSNFHGHDRELDHGSGMITEIINNILINKSNHIYL